MRKSGAVYNPHVKAGVKQQEVESELWVGAARYRLCSTGTGTTTTCSY